MRKGSGCTSRKAPAGQGGPRPHIRCPDGVLGVREPRVPSRCGFGGEPAICSDMAAMGYGMAMRMHIFV